MNGIRGVNKYSEDFWHIDSPYYTYDRATNFFKNTSMAQNCLNHQERQKICCTLKSSTNISHYFESTANSCTAEVLAQSLYGKNVSFVLISFLF